MKKIQIEYVLLFIVYWILIRIVPVNIISSYLYSSELISIAITTIVTIALLRLTVMSRVLVKRHSQDEIVQKLPGSTIVQINKRVFFSIIILLALTVFYIGTEFASYSVGLQVIRYVLSPIVWVSYWPLLMILLPTDYDRGVELDWLAFIIIFGPISIIYQYISIKTLLEYYYRHIFKKYSFSQNSETYHTLAALEKKQLRRKAARISTIIIAPIVVPSFIFVVIDWYTSLWYILFPDIMYEGLADTVSMAMYAFILWPLLYYIINIILEIKYLKHRNKTTNSS